MPHARHTRVESSAFDFAGGSFDDPSWLNGPPYAVEEVVFDENELVGCFRSEAELRGGEPD